MTGRSERASRFLPDGRMKTAVQRRLDESSVHDRETGGLRTNRERTLESASRYDRRTGIMKVWR